MDKETIIKELENILKDSPWNATINLKKFIERLKKEYVPKQRTLDQNSALHLAFTMLAERLNESGLEMRAVLKQDYKLWWTTWSVKEYLFRPLMKAMTGKESTAQLSKLNEIDLVWDKLMLELGEKFGLEAVPFPHDPNKPRGVN